MEFWFCRKDFIPDLHEFLVRVNVLVDREQLYWAQSLVGMLDRIGFLGQYFF